MLLMKEDLFDLLTGNPPNTITNEWTKKDNKARAIIYITLEDKQLIYVKNGTTARASWQASKTIHECQNLSSKLYLVRKLYSTKLAEGVNMTDYVVKNSETADKLKGIKDSHPSSLLLCSPAVL